MTKAGGTALLKSDKYDSSNSHLEFPHVRPGRPHDPRGFGYDAADLFLYHRNRTFFFIEKNT